MFENHSNGVKRKHDTLVPTFPGTTDHVDFLRDETSHALQAAGDNAVNETSKFRRTTLSGDNLSDEDNFSFSESDSENHSSDVGTFDDECNGDTEAPSKSSNKCACCDLSTSQLMKKLDAVADKLAGRASDSRVNAIQLEIFNAEVAALKAEGREVPHITKRVLRKHYTEHRISPIRSVAEDIRIFELAERTLRKTGLAEEDEDGVKVLNSRGAAELCKLSKSKLDALKFYVSLDKIRKEEEANEGLRR